jgi:uncharacterized protein YabE (DUF348 family)
VIRRPPSFVLSPGFLAIVTLLSLLAAVGCRPSAVPFTILDGETSILIDGHYDTVGEVLAAVGLTLGEGDSVSPAPGAPAHPATPIAIDRAAEVTVLTLDSAQTYRTQQTTLGGFLREIDLNLPPGARLLADGQPVADPQIHPLPSHLAIDPYKTVIIEDGANRRALRTTALTVGEALSEAGMTLAALDSVAPPREAALSPDLTIVISRAAPYRITADGQTVEAHSGSTVVAQVLADNGIALGPLDYTRPPLDATVAPGDAIEVVRVVELIETEDVAIGFETVYEAAADMEIDTIMEASAGRPGVLQRRTRVRLENGVEVSRAPDGEVVTVAPQNHVIRYGTQIVVRVIDTPEGPAEYWRKVTMRVTSYTAATSGKAPGDPGYGITASGVQAGFGVVAVDPTVVPFKSYVFVPGYGVAFAGDTGGGIKGRFIDLGYDEGALKSWRGTVDVYYLGQPPAAEEIRWVLP